MRHPDLLQKIRTIPDFPKPGILFYDITTLLQDAHGFQETVDRMADAWVTERPEMVVGIDARGFILASAIAYKLNTGLVLVRKQGKLPYATERVEYELEYGSSAVEIHTDAVAGGKRTLVVDDLLATGGTAEATGELVTRTGGELIGYSFVIELANLGGRKRLGNAAVESLIVVD